MRRSPGFSLVVIGTLALGIGVNTAIFSVVHEVLLKPLPYPGAERLVKFGESAGKAQGISVSWGNFQNWRESNHTFEAMAAFQFTERTLTGRGDPVVTLGLTVTAPYFSLLGMRPILGRLFNPEDDRPGARPGDRPQPPLLVAPTRRRPEHRRRHAHLQRHSRRSRRCGRAALGTLESGLLSAPRPRRRSDRQSRPARLHSRARDACGPA